jgi:hypothetical protein
MVYVRGEIGVVAMVSSLLLLTRLTLPSGACLARDGSKLLVWDPSRVGVKA